MAEMDEDFDPEGSGYDVRTATKARLKKDESGHWPSREPESGLLLKGRNHPTWKLTEQGEAAANHEIYKKDGRYYSRPKKGFGIGK